MSDTLRRRFSLTEVCELTGIERTTVITFIEHEWIRPAQAQAANYELDEEDLARIRLIHELRTSFGANDEAIPLILHLMDQLYCLRARVRNAGNEGR